MGVRTLSRGMKRLWPFLAILSLVAVEAMASDCSG
jgi:hypothetical protein